MNTTRLIGKLKKPNKEVFFESKDVNDIRLGAMVSSDSKAYSKCGFVIIGCPQDQGVQRNNGRIGAAEAPDAIRNSLYRLAAPFGLKAGQLLDLGNLPIAGTLEEIHDLHNSLVESLLQDGKTVIVLGGGNDISYPDAKAVQAIYPGSMAVNVDAHLDIRINPVRNSGTPYRQLLDENIIDPARFFEIAYQFHANSAKYLADAEKAGINLLSLSDLLKEPIKKSLDKIFILDKSQTCFLGFDMDAVKAADAPGVSAPSPTGLTAEQAVEIVEFLAIYKDTRLFEITELNPKYDLDSRTTKLAAILIFKFLSRTIEKMGFATI